MSAAFSTFTVAQHGSALRLDQLLMRQAGLSRRQARLCISLGRVQVDGRPARIVARRPPVGAAVAWQLPSGLSRPKAGGAGEADSGGPRHGYDCDHGRSQSRAGALPAAPREPHILFLDRDLVVVNKPAGLLSEPDRFGSPSVLDRLAVALHARGEQAHLWLVHRLDAGTSGVMVLARRPQAARALNAAFAERQVEKVYLALATGGIDGPCSVAAPIARIKGTQHGVCAAGKPALTRLSPRGPAGRPSPQLRPRADSAAQLVEARPRSGRTHQIRVHLASLGCPIVGDGLYGGPRRTPAGPTGLGAEAVTRPMLHACALALSHPRDRSRMRWTAPCPADFLACAAAFSLDLAADTLMATEP